MIMTVVMCVRRPGSILNKDHPPDKKPKSEKVSVPPTHDFDPTGKSLFLNTSDPGEIFSPGFTAE